MTHTPRKKTIKYLPILSAVAIVTCGMVVGVTLYQYTNEKENFPFLKVSPLPETATIDATLQSRTGTAVLAFRNGTASLPEHTAKDFKPPYRISGTIRFPDDAYRDFRITVTNDNKILSVADGFHAGDLVSLRLNGRDVYKDLPADWSGKIELDATLPEKSAANLCIEVVGKTESLEFCHARPAERPS